MKWCATWLLLGCASGSAAPPDAAAMDASTADQAAVADTWSNFAQGFFATYCVSCHSPTGSDANGGKDFTQYASVAANSSLIRCGVAVAQDASWSCPAFPPPRQFPICNNACSNPKPTDAERTRLVNWITAGLPQ